MIFSNIYKPLFKYEKTEFNYNDKVSKDNFIYTKEYYDDVRLDNTDIAIDFKGNAYHIKNNEY